MASENLLGASSWVSRQIDALTASLGVTSASGADEDAKVADALQEIRHQYAEKLCGTYRGRTGGGQQIFTVSSPEGDQIKVVVHNCKNPLDTHRCQIYATGNVNDAQELVCTINKALKGKKQGGAEAPAEIRTATIDRDGGLVWSNGRRWMPYDLSSWEEEQAAKNYVPEVGDPMPLKPPNEPLEVLPKNKRGKDRLFMELSTRVGVSMCIAGRKVRHNGGDCGKSELLNSIRRYVEIVPVCPEFGVGMGVPREPVRLVVNADEEGDPMDIEDWGNIRLMGNQTGQDVTQPMWDYCRHAVEKLRELDIDGMILKSKSPTCGMLGIPVYKSYDVRPKMKREGPSMGMFAHVLKQAWPELPMQEDGVLKDMRFREKWVTQVFCHSRWRRMKQEAAEVKSAKKRIHLLSTYHCDHKYLFRAILGMEKTKELGLIVSQWKENGTRDEASDNYYSLLFRGLNEVYLSPEVWGVSIKRLVQRMKLDEDIKETIEESVEDYESGLQSKSVPLAVVKMMSKSQAPRDAAYMSKQILLHPYPKDLRLASHVPPMAKDGTPSKQKNPGCKKK